MTQQFTESKSVLKKEKPARIVIAYNVLWPVCDMRTSAALPHATIPATCSCARSTAYTIKLGVLLGGGPRHGSR
jgi:hypothetical protein